MELNLHSGGELVTIDQLASLATPERTATHVPIPHFDVVNMVRYSLGFFGHEIVEEHHAIDKDGDRYFGAMVLKSPYGDYTDLVGLRNSHDRKFPIGIAIGSAVFVCSNLAFFGEHVIKRKHTANAKRDLPGLVAHVIEPLGEARKAQALTFERYKGTELTEDWANQAIMRMYRQGAINVTKIADVLTAYEEPPHDWGNRTAWRMFNAATFALTGRVAEDPRITKTVHQVLDGVCEVLN